MGVRKSENLVDCPYCQSDDTVDGSLAPFDFHTMYFRPDGAPTLGSSSYTAVEASMCMACGRMWLWGSRRAVKKALSRIVEI